MKAELKKRFQCRDCDMPYCDISCDDLTDEAIDSIMELANQRVIEELEKQVDEYFKQPTEIDLSKRLKDRINELKQERL
tara:strand:- start:256 stop:492 length:237 start_codon:yes stop_codon:yes gene_type:complete